MAKNFISPGVFTNEVDASFLGPGVGAIGAAIIGTAPKGPAFVPVTVNNFDQYATFFGDLNTSHLMGYAAKAYLQNAPAGNFIRVLGPSGRTHNGVAVTAGYTAEKLLGIVANTVSASVGKLLAIIDVTGSTHIDVRDLGSDLFALSASEQGATTTGFWASSITASFQTGSQYYIRKVLNTDPTKWNQYGHYLKAVYDFAKPIFGDSTIEVGSASLSTMTNFAIGYNSGSTPWIKSQKFSNQEYNLFRIHTLGHGNAENGRFKVSIKNIRVSAAPGVYDYGKFDLELREFTDTDASPSVVESFPNLSMDPADSGYIAKQIGDKFWQYDFSQNKMIEYGNYDNGSNYIRVEMVTGSFPQTALPWGFRGLAKPNLMSGSTANIVPSIPLTPDLLDKSTRSLTTDGIYWGMDTELSGNVADRLQYMPIMTASDSDFSLANVSGSANYNFVYNASNTDSVKAPGDTNSNTVLEYTNARFTIPIAFGFDGFDPKKVDPLANDAELAAASQLGAQALRQAIDIISDPDFIDINLLCIPGINKKTVVDYGIQKIEDRADALYVIDITGSSVTSTVNEVKGRSFDSNYACCYYPSIRVKDTVNNVIKIVPPSIPAIAAMAYTDRVSYPWFAPAGLNRAGLTQDVVGFDVAGIGDFNISQGSPKAAERDKLYENRINPITRFPDVPKGVIWGQKTLQLKASALDRINVRRLLIKAKKLIASSVKYLVFEPNNASTQTRFRQLVNPILADIQQKQGLEVFKVVMDSTTNTPDLIDRNIMAGKIYLVPTRSAEFISIDFIISPSGATFAD